jgi:hypothetical protein
MIRIEAFGGMIPLKDNRLLSDYHAGLAQNCYVQAGTIRPAAALIQLHTMSNNNRSFFRIPKASPSIDNMIDSFWLEFPLENTWVVRSPTAELDDDGRYYWADGVNPPQYTTGKRVKGMNTTWDATVAYAVGDFTTYLGVTYVAILGGTNNPPNTSPTYWSAAPLKLTLGIPTPAVAPGVAVAGGTTPVETRAYVYTWRSVSGEEGPPSPPTVVTGNMNGTWNITMTAPTVDNTTGRTLSTTRIYRTVTNAQGVATFFFVAEVPITTLTYADTIPDATVALNDMLQSTNWLPPPADLNGLVAMPNGMIAGFRAHGEIWFCEPYQPHAWPPQYMIAVEGPIIGLGVQQQSLVILTAGWTWIATGVSPTTMALTKVANLEPCTSMGSIVSAPEGVLYTSVNGLIVCSSGIEVNGTANLVRKDQWPTLLYLPNLHACYINRSYLAFSAPNDEGVFQADTFQVATPPPGLSTDTFESKNYTGTRDGALISLTDERAGFMPLHSDHPVQNVLQDIWTGEALLMRDNIVYHLDVRQYTPRISDYLWRSKVFQTPYVENWAAAKVFYGPNPGLATPDAPTYFRFYADGRMIFQRALQRSGEQFRLPSGYKSDFIQFELAGQLEIYNVQIATSARELRNA